MRKRLCKAKLNSPFREPQASKLTALRIQARRKHRITYDCMNAVTCLQEGVVICKKGHEFKPVGKMQKGMSLLSVLRGMCSSVCRKCKDYNGEDDE